MAFPSDSIIRNQPNGYAFKPWSASSEANHQPRERGKAVTFIESIKTCFQKYIDFGGRASRSEYWWFFLFTFIARIVLGFIPVIGFIVTLALILPSLSVTVRRLHDTDRTGQDRLVVASSYRLNRGWNYCGRGHDNSGRGRRLPWSDITGHRSLTDWVDSGLRGFAGVHDTARGPASQSRWPRPAATAGESRGIQGVGPPLHPTISARIQRGSIGYIARTGAGRPAILHAVRDAAAA